MFQVVQNSLTQKIYSLIAKSMWYIYSVFEKWNSPHSSRCCTTTQQIRNSATGVGFLRCYFHCTIPNCSWPYETRWYTKTSTLYKKRSIEFSTKPNTKNSTFQYQAYAI